MPEVFLISRTDRAGDLILTLPVFAALRQAFPKSQIVGLVRRYTAPLLRNRTDVDEILLDDPVPTGQTLFRLAKQLKSRKITAAILVHPSFRSICAAWLAGIPVRVGRASNVWQFFLNRRMVQNRSANQKHEMEYNLDLLTGLGIEPARQVPRLYISPRAFRQGREILDRHGFQEKKLIVIHPGGGGSAFNLSGVKYGQMAAILREREFDPVVTIGPGEESLKAFIPSGIPIIEGLADLEALGGVLSHARAFIGGSTGPMHVAGALGIPVAAFFPPLPAMTPKRWGPTGERHLILMPPVSACPHDCPACDFHPCMDQIALEPLFPWLESV